MEREVKQKMRGRRVGVVEGRGEVISHPSGSIEAFDFAPTSLFCSTALRDERVLSLGNGRHRAPRESASVALEPTALQGREGGREGGRELEREGA